MLQWLFLYLIVWLKFTDVLSLLLRNVPFAKFSNFWNIILFPGFLYFFGLSWGFFFRCCFLWPILFFISQLVFEKSNEFLWISRVSDTFVVNVLEKLLRSSDIESTAWTYHPSLQTFHPLYSFALFGQSLHFYLFLFRAFIDM